MRTLAIDPNSSTVSTIEYDVEQEIMRVTFKTDGTTHEAVGVPAEIATELEQPGASPGKIWHRKLKAPNFTWVKV